MFLSVPKNSLASGRLCLRILLPKYIIFPFLKLSKCFTLFHYRGGQIWEREERKEEGGRAEWKEGKMRNLNAPYRRQGFPGGLQCGRPGFDPWVGKIPWRREWLPTPVFWPGESHGLYSPWGCKESDTTEWLSLIGDETSNRLLEYMKTIQCICTCWKYPPQNWWTK